MKNYKTISLLRLLKCIFELSSSVGIIISFWVYYFKENEVLGKHLDKEAAKAGREAYTLFCARS